MKIKGADGLTPEMIRDEVDRGGRLVIYVYTISLLVITFKRPTGIYFIRAGQSPGVKGLPFAAVTLLLGWWGFPWGPIYSIESLYKTLRGGIDVTDDVVASIAPRNSPPPIPGGPTPPLHGESPLRPSAPTAKPIRSFTPRQLALGAAAITGGITAVYALVCYAAGTHTVAVLNGLPTPATYTINDQTAEIGPRGFKLLQMPEGDFTVSSISSTPAPGSARAETFRVETPFWSRPFNRQVIVINPDRAAVFYRYHVIYKADGVTGDDHGQPTDFTLYANESHYLVPSQDYDFVKAPSRVEMPKGSRFSSKTRLALYETRDVDERIETLETNLGPEAAAAYARNLALVQPDDEASLVTAMQHLPLEDMLALLETRLADRPVRTEWHRYFQNVSQRLHPESDLVPRYRALADAEPDDGALHYLLARILDDDAETRSRYERALAAKLPCGYAHLGLGHLDLRQGKFADALARFDQGIAAGVKSASLLQARRDMLVATGRHDELLREVQARRAANPASVLTAAEEIDCVLAASRNAGEARAIKQSVLARIKDESTAEDHHLATCYLDATVAYGLGDETAFARAIAQMPGPRYAFNAAVSLRDLAAAGKALAEVEEPGHHALFTLHLLALQSRDQAAADAAWTRAVEALSKAGADSAPRTADQLAGRTPLDPAWLHDNDLDATTKALLFACLARRDEARRATYVTWSREFNYTRAFPRAFIAAVTAGAPAVRD